MKKMMLVCCFVMAFLVPLQGLHVIAAEPQNFSNIYDVKAGDTLWRIANTYRASVNDLKLANGLQSDLIRVNQQLFVPMTYEVASGDTLWRLATTYNSSVQQIKEGNRLASDLIFVGQKLTLPQKKLNMEGQYVLMTREEFRNWLFHQQFSRKISIIQEHHTWSPSYKHFNGSNHFALLKGMENFHVNEMGWNNIAQNLTTFPDGKIAVSRPFDIAPDGTIGPYANSIGLNIENVGNFDKGFDEMTAAQRETIVYLTALLCIKFGLTPSIDSITYHHWWDMRTKERVLDNSEGHSVKTCPGTGFFGGNSTEAAKRHFYPLVEQKVKDILATM